MTNNDTTDRKILVWDAPVRVFHWLLALSFFGAYITSEGEYWRLVHVTLGYTAGALVAFRLLWGVLGTRHARFASFVRGPAAVRQYLGSLLRGQPEHYTGHNPAGALAIVTLLALTAVTVLLGWATYSDLGGEWVAEAHDLAGNLMLGVVVVHVLAVVVASRLHHENLARAMVTGRKLGSPQEAVRHAWWGLAALMLVSALAFWGWQWRTAPQAQGDLTAIAAPGHADRSGQRDPDDGHGDAQGERERHER